jgi:hypothetical protein
MTSNKQRRTELTALPMLPTEPLSIGVDILPGRTRGSIDRRAGRLGVQKEVEWSWKQTGRHSESILTDTDREIMTLYTITEEELSVPGVKLLRCSEVSSECDSGFTPEALDKPDVTVGLRRKHWINRMRNCNQAQEYEAWSWLEQEGWGLVAIEPPDPIKPGICKYYFKRQCLPPAATTTTRTTAGLRAIERYEQQRR